MPLLEETLAEAGVIIHDVTGVSMLPMLDQNNDKVVIKPITRPIKKYDLPLYKRPGGAYVLHRVIAVRKKYLIICGDNQYCKEKVPREWLIGIAVGYYKGEKYVSCDDENYKKYARRICRSRTFRRVRGYFLHLKSRLGRLLRGKKK